MTEHRKSYWKTAAGTAALALAGFAAIVWLVFEKQIAQRPWPALVALAWWAAGLALLCAEMVTVLILAGALISLRRDSLETRGLAIYGTPTRMAWRIRSARRSCAFARPAYPSGA